MVLCSFRRSLLGKSALEVGQFLRQNFWMISGGPISLKNVRWLFFSKQGSTPSPLPLGRGVCETKSEKGRSRDRTSFMRRAYNAQRGIETMVSDHAVSEGAGPWGRDRSEFIKLWVSEKMKNFTRNSLKKSFVPEDYTLARKDYIHSRRPPDCSSNLCPPKTFAIWLFKGGVFWAFFLLFFLQKKGPKHPPKKSYSKCLIGGHRLDE